VIHVQNNIKEVNALLIVSHFDNSLRLLTTVVPFVTSIQIPSKPLVVSANFVSLLRERVDKVDVLFVDDESLLAATSKATRQKG
jgi:hypothetical protein